MVMNKRGDIGAYPVRRDRGGLKLINILIGIILIVIAFNSRFGWYSLEIAGLSLAALFSFALGVLLLVMGFMTKRVTTFLLAILFIVIGINASVWWNSIDILSFSKTTGSLLFGFDLTGLILLTLGVVWLVFEFLRKPIYR